MTVRPANTFLYCDYWGKGYFLGFTGLCGPFRFFGLKARLSSIDNHPRIGERSRQDVENLDFLDRRDHDKQGGRLFICCIARGSRLSYIYI